MKPSDRARALIEALHEPTSNEERWTIAERFLAEERDEGVRAFMDSVMTYHGCEPPTEATTEEPK